eukprot:scpid91229/ scgid33124/ 
MVRKVEDVPSSMSRQRSKPGKKILKVWPSQTPNTKFNLPTSDISSELVRSNIIAGYANSSHTKQLPQNSDTARAQERQIDAMSYTEGMAWLVFSLDRTLLAVTTVRLYTLEAGC